MTAGMRLVISPNSGLFRTLDDNAPRGASTIRVVE